MWDYEKLSDKYTGRQLKKLQEHVPKVKPCENCGTPFDCISYHFRPTAIYSYERATCSKECTKQFAGSKNKRVFKQYKCEGCGLEFKPNKRKPHQRFCNKKCRGLLLKGRARPAVQEWIHKITPPRGSVSKSCTAWLDSLNVPLREQLIQVSNRWYRVDGYDPTTNTIYEYLGSFWHGNPALYEPTEIHPVAGVPFGELYSKTMERLQTLQEAGYNTVYVWSER